MLPSRLDKDFGGNTSITRYSLVISKQFSTSQVRMARGRIKTLTFPSQGILRVADIIPVVSVIDAENTARKDGNQSRFEH